MAGNWSLRAEPAFEGYNVEWAEPRRLILSRLNQLFETTAPGQPIVPIARFDAPRLLTLAAHVRAAQRLLRFSFYNVVRQPDGSFFLSFGKSIALLRGGKVSNVSGLLRPTRILRNACAIDNNGDLYFGEYINFERGPVHIYRLPAGSDRLEIAHRFAANEITHVHGIYRDPFEGGLWCVTGDKPSECRVLRSFDGFRTMEVIGSGDESWRTVSLVFTQEAVYYGTDSEFQQNHLYRLPRCAERTALTPVEGPVYYSTSIGPDQFFGVTAEMCPSQTEPAGVLWHANKTTTTRIAAFPKDALPRNYFQMGTLNFAGGPGTGDGSVYFHGIALRGVDNRVMRLSRT